MYRRLSFYTYHRPVYLLQLRFAIKPKVKAGYKTPYDLNYDRNVIQPHPQTSERFRMTYQRVVRSGSTEAYHRRGQENSEDEFVGPRRLREATDEVAVKRITGQENEDGGNEMRVDVDGLVVQVG
jgi:hypothetical protein